MLAGLMRPADMRVAYARMNGRSRYRPRRHRRVAQRRGRPLIRVRSQHSPLRRYAAFSFQSWRR